MGPTELSPLLLALLLPLIATIVIVGKPYWLLCIGLMTAVLPMADWFIGGTRLDPMDLVMFGVMGVAILRPSSQRTRIPYMRLWLAIGVLSTLAYVNAPINQPNLTDPARIAYQIYRYCWKPLLFYPLTCRLVGTDGIRSQTMLHVIMLGGIVISIHASIQGYALMDPRGYFSGGNSMGGVLLVPLVLAAAGSLVPGKRRMYYVAALLILVRGIIFAGSRGAIVATAAGVFTFFALLTTWSVGRKVVAQTAVLGIVGIVGVFVVDPNFLERPNVAHLLTALQGTADSNLQWRMQERWPVFEEKIRAHPWLGIGTNRDESLSEDANTPHNGYLSLAVIYGIPLAVLIIIFTLLGARNGWRAARGATTGEERLWMFAAIASIAGVLIHNLVESTIIIPFVMNYVLTLTAITSMRALTQSAPAAAPSAAPARRRRPIRRRPLRPAYGGEA